MGGFGQGRGAGREEVRVFRLLRVGAVAFLVWKWLAGRLCPDPELIRIVQPGRNATVTSPVALSGAGRAAQHNALGVRVRDQNGTEIGSGTVQVAATLGQRGPFSGSVGYALAGGSQPGRIEVFDTSSRDGQVTHLASVEVTLT